MAKLTLGNLDVRGKRVLVRVDFNVPIETGPFGRLVVSDDTRIRAALETLRTILEAGGRAILISHMGRPNGVPSARLSLAPVAKHLEAVLKVPVKFASDTVGPAAIAAVNSTADVILLENTRFAAGETKNDPDFAARLAVFGDVFVNDAFGTAHRAHASNVGVAHCINRSAAGLLLEREVRYLTRVTETPERPFVAILGGAKVSDKIGVIVNLLPKVDSLLIGGAMSYTFLKALGHSVGSSLVEHDRLDEALSLLEAADGKIHLPEDHVVAERISNDADARVCEVIPDGMMGLDTGPLTCAAFKGKILSARTVVWNGPMGVFELPSFAAGTRAMAEALAMATENDAVTLVGGGDSVAALTRGGYADAVTHVSTGGGAMLTFLEGTVLPGLAALSDQD